MTMQGFLALGMPAYIAKTVSSALIAKSTNNAKFQEQNRKTTCHDLKQISGFCSSIAST